MSRCVLYRANRCYGYLGMGIMGVEMSLNLLKAGYKVLVWNRTRVKVL